MRHRADDLVTCFLAPRVFIMCTLALRRSKSHGEPAPGHARRATGFVAWANTNC